MIVRGPLRACRIAFVVASLVPTLAGSVGLMWRARRDSPREQVEVAEWPKSLQMLLGGTVAAQRVESQVPQQATLVGVTLVDAATGAPWAWLPQLAVCRTGAAWELATDLLVLDCEHLDFAAEACLAVRPGAGVTVAPPGDWKLTAHRLLLQAGPFQQTFQQASISVTRQTTGQLEAKLTIVALAAEQDPAEAPLRLEWVRTHGEQGTCATARLATGAAHVACRALAALWPSAARLGTACEFRGSVSWSHAGHDEHVVVAGELIGVDLDALISEQFPHRLSGTARVQIDRAVLQQGRLTELRGAITAKGGVLSASLLAAAAEHLQLAAPRKLIESPPATAVPFERLHLTFHLDGSHLAFDPGADPAQNRTLLAGTGGPLLSAPAGHRVPAVALLRMLVPGGEYQVPATRQTAMLVRLLPVPEAPAMIAGGHTPTRLAPAPQAESTASPPLKAPGLR